MWKTGKFYLWLIRFIGLIVPRRLRADWRQEWEAELQYREEMLAEWERLTWQNKLDLLQRSASAFWDAMVLQPKRWEDEMIQDIRFGIRSLGQRPGFTLLVVVTLALGIGANTAIFSLFNGLVLKPLSYPEPERLVSVCVSATKGMRYEPNASANFSSASPGAFHDWRSRSHSFASVTASRMNSTILADGEQSLYAATHRVAEQFFETYGVKAQLGRTFSAEDYRATNTAPIIMDYKLWQSRYGADPSVVGRTVKLDGELRTVIGVMPSTFWPTISPIPRVWVPYVFNAEEQVNRQAGRWNVMARLRPGVSLAQAQAEMDALAAQLNAEFPSDYQNQGIVLIPEAASFLESLGNTRQVFRLLFGAVILVLLIACVNVANLLLVRALEREREFAVRAALGASGLRLARQLLTESLLLAGLGGAAGVLLGASGMRLLAAFMTATVPRLDELRFDWQAFAFTGGIALLTGLLFGLVPAFRAARPDLQQALNEGGRGKAASARRRRLGRVLVVGEFAVALLLVIGAGLIVQSFSRLQQVDPGFATDRLLTMHVNVPDFKYGRFMTESVPGKPEFISRTKLYPEIEERLNALPGVESAAVAARLPITYGPRATAISIAGRDGDTSASLFDDSKNCEVLRRKTRLPCHGTVGINKVTKEYLRTLGLHLARGRWFDARDQSDTPGVAVISETTARKYWPQADPIGQRLTLNYTHHFPQVEIIGVVSDIKTDDLSKPPYPEIYQPMTQQPSDDATLLIRTQAAPETLVAAVRAEFTRLDPDMPLRNVETMEGIIAGSLWRARLAAWLLGLFAALAVTLAAAGLFGVMSYVVRQRTNEIAIRMALGATAANILQSVLVEGLRLVLTGLLIGLGAAVMLGRWLADWLFGITPTDGLTYAGAACFLAVMALLASWLPAHRATKVDPMIALRQE